MSKNTSILSAGRPSTRNNKAATLASLSDNVEIKRVNFQVSAEQHTKLKIFAAKKGKSIKELLTDFVDGLDE